MPSEIIHLIAQPDAHTSMRYRSPKTYTGIHEIYVCDTRQRIGLTGSYSPG